MLTRDQLREIRKSMTWGDQRYAKQQLNTDDDDNSEVAVHGMFRSAKRLGLAEDLDAFLDAVAIDDLSAILTEDRDPTTGDTTT